MRSKHSLIYLTFLILNFWYGICVNVTEVDYYENLINAEIEKSKHYVLPTSAEEYKPTPNSFEKNFGTFDFIVVGAGAAGAVVANRLSEKKQWKVLLIEAGGSETNFSVIPGMHSYVRSSRLNWGFFSTIQNKSCLGFVNSRCPLERGKALGGSTAINYEFYTRGNKADYDNWEKEGNPGWSYRNVLPYFIKSENSEVNGDPGFRGKHGYWNLKYTSPDIDDPTKAFINGSNVIQKNISSDYNGKSQLGAFRRQLNNIGGIRQSTSIAFLEPILKRKNLHITTESYVTKIKLNSFFKTATGVTFTRNGSTYRAQAKKEVIISGGAYNSPQILMLSGIGPREHLKKHNIPVLSDLPVGKTLYDHGNFYAAYVSINSTLPNPLTLREQIIQFLNFSGPLTNPSGYQAVGFYCSILESNPQYPDIEVLETLPNELESFLRVVQVTNETFDAIINNTKGKTIMQFNVLALRTKSFGTVALESSDPFKYPLLDTNFLSDDHDLEVMYLGIEIIKRILETEPLRKINATLIPIDYPQCRNYELGSKNHWFCAFRLLTSSAHHPSTSCRMGPDPRNSVVNSRGVIHGWKKLRVIDASIMPFALAGHSAAPTVMLAEKLSDSIKLDHGVPIEPITNVIV